MLAILRQRNIALLWLGGLISFAGDWVLYIALPVYVYDLTGSALWLIVSNVSVVLFSLAERKKNNKKMGYH